MTSTVDPFPSREGARFTLVSFAITLALQLDIMSLCAFTVVHALEVADSAPDPRGF